MTPKTAALTIAIIATVAASTVVSGLVATGIRRKAEARDSTEAVAATAVVVDRQPNRVLSRGKSVRFRKVRQDGNQIFALIDENQGSSAEALGQASSILDDRSKQKILIMFWSDLRFVPTQNMEPNEVQATMEKAMFFRDDDRGARFLLWPNMAITDLDKNYKPKNAGVGQP